MLSYHSRQLLKELLVQIGKQEKQLEVVRQVLCEQPEFEPYAGFRRIDRARKGYITHIDIHEFLLSNNFNFTEEECWIYIHHYDRDNDKKLSYSEFLPSLLPFDNPDLRTMVTQRKVVDIGYDEFLPYEVEYALSRIIAKEITYYKDLEGLKIELANEYDFTFFDAFSSIDIYETGYIDYNLLKNFLKTSGQFPQEEQIIEILRRIDKDDDGRIKYEEFVEAIQPVTSLGNRVDSKKARKLSENYEKAKHPPQNLFEDKSALDYRIPKTFKSSIRATSPLKTRYLSPETKTSKSLKYSSPLKKFSQTAEGFSRTEEKRSEKTFLDKERSNSKLSKSTQKKQRSKTPKKTRSSQFFKDLNPLTSLMFIFKELISLEREVEFAKQDLALRSDFNLLDSFRLFDKKGKGIITVREFENVFKEFDLYPAKEDTYLLIKRLDKDGDGKLKFIEFTSGFASCQKEYYELLRGRPGVNGEMNLSIKELFDDQTRKVFKRLLMIYLENEAIVEALRQKLSRDKEFSVRKAFELMDLDGDGYLTLPELREVLEQSEVYVTDKDVEYLINRFNKNDTRKISYAEFVQEISPKSQKKY